MSYHRLDDGEWAATSPEGFVKVACCDCRLTHVLQIEKAEQGFQYRAWRDVRATAGKRKHLHPSYIAGFFDGEGSITIHENSKPSPRGKNPNHTLQVSIGNTDPRVLRKIHAQFGGGLTHRKLVSPKHRPVTQWFVRAAQALPFLLAIRPFIYMKGEQIDIAIRFQQSKKMRGPLLVTPKKLQWREEQRQKIRALNARTIS
jgi:hypothetical protein